MGERARRWHLLFSTENGSLLPDQLLHSLSLRATGGAGAVGWVCAHGRMATTTCRGSAVLREFPNFGLSLGRLRMTPHTVEKERRRGQAGRGHSAAATSLPLQPQGHACSSLAARGLHPSPALLPEKGSPPRLGFFICDTGFPVLPYLHHRIRVRLEERASVKIKPK